MKRALLVGIDHYSNFNDLGGCANDAEALEPLLARNEDNSPNFSCRTLTARHGSTPVTRDALLEHVNELLAPSGTFALLYFAGHGTPVNGDVSLVASDGTHTTPGVLFSEILTLINNSSVSEVVVSLTVASPVEQRQSER